MEELPNTKSSSKEGWKLAKEGIDLLLNNRIEDAEKLFKTNTEDIQLAAGYSFLTFINALMSYEDEKLTIALNALKETEKKCSNDIGWIKVVKNKMLGVNNQTQSLAESLEEQIILADTQVCLAILTFLQQEFSGYVKGGWVLRKAWKVYQSVYNEVLELYIKEFGVLNTDITDYPHLPKIYLGSATSSTSTIHNNTNSIKESSSTWSVQLAASNNASDSIHSSVQSSLNDLKDDVIDENDDNNIIVPKKCLTPNGYTTSIHHSNYARSNESNMTRSASGTSFKFSRITQSLSYPLGFLSGMIHSSSTNISENFETNNDAISPEQISRLMAAVSFGYGVFQLSASLLPPTMLKLTQLFGFGADRKAGIESLMYARKGNDMRAPLASLALLWYHTIVRPFFALDGYNLQAGVKAASALMEEAQCDYSQSALFLFFEGRIKRLESNITKALECYQLAVDNSNQREIKLLCLHEVGWCYLIKLDFVEGNTTFTLLKQRSRWSRSFYGYLALICAGACNILTEFTDIVDLQNILSNSNQKTSQLDVYLNRRIKMFPENEIELQKCDVSYWKMFTYELLYLWNALPSCSQGILENILDDCQKNDSKEPMVGLSDLIAGSCYSIFNNQEKSIEAYRNCLSKRENQCAINNNCSHIGAFAQYELATLLLKNSETAVEGKQMLLRIQNEYKDYDFEHRLNVRIHTILKRL